MIDKQQGPTHTRTPQGTSAHRCRPCFRNLVMGLILCFIALVVLVIVFVAGDHISWSNLEDDKLDDAASAAGAIALVHHQRASNEEKGPVYSLEQTTS